MAKKSKKWPSRTRGTTEPEGGSFQWDAFDLIQKTLHILRKELEQVVEETFRDAPQDLDAARVIPRELLRSVVRLNGPGGDWPLSPSEFVKIINESPFKGLVLAAEQSSQPSSAEEDNWQPRNQRRLSLIRKGLTRSLTDEEQSELQQLQDELDKRLESHDNRLLEQLQQMKEAVERLPSED
jgi:hypothetical protein